MNRQLEYSIQLKCKLAFELWTKLVNGLHFQGYFWIFLLSQTNVKLLYFFVTHMIFYLQQINTMEAFIARNDLSSCIIKNMKVGSQGNDHWIWLEDTSTLLIVKSTFSAFYNLQFIELTKSIHVELYGFNCFPKNLFLLLYVL